MKCVYFLPSKWDLSALQVRAIVEDLLTQRKKTQELSKVLFGQIVAFVLMCVVVFVVVVLAIELTKSTWIQDRTLIDRITQKPVRAANVEKTKGLMHVANLPTEAFTHLKTVTVVFDMTGMLFHLCSGFWSV